MAPLIRLGLAALATWRVTHLLVNEDGPAQAVSRVRESLGSSELGAAMDCFYCTSIWVALPFTFYAARRPSDRLVSWLALSATACLLNRATNHEHQSWALVR
jgi:hypothetical protein